MTSVRDFILKGVKEDPDLRLVRADEKRQEILNTLHSEDPDHYSRLWLVGFLRFVGYDETEVLDIIDKGNSWADYDSRITQRQVSSVFRKNAKRDIQEAVEGGTSRPVTVLSKRLVVDFDPELCIIGNTRITCYYKKCERCPIKEGVE